jgi:hypothetical protein
MHNLLDARDSKSFVSKEKSVFIEIFDLKVMFSCSGGLFPSGVEIAKMW